jgi:hypothetical protein
MSWGGLLHARLTDLDRFGRAYTVSIDGGAHLSVMKHTSECLVICDQNTLLYVNLGRVKSVEVEEL